MWKVPENPILSNEDAMRLLDSQISSSMDWEAFYSEEKRKPPFLENIPDENLVGYFRDGLISNGKTLEVGCGPGRNAIYLAEQGCEVDAIDLSTTAIRKAGTRANDAGVHVSFYTRSVFDLGAEPTTFDLVYDSGLLHHLTPHRRTQYLDLVRKVLKPRGRFGLVCFSEGGAPGPPDWRIYQDRSMPAGLGYSKERLRLVLSRNFEIIDFRPMEAKPSSSGLLGMEGFWTVLMKIRG